MHINTSVGITLYYTHHTCLGCRAQPVVMGRTNFDCSKNWVLETNEHLGAIISSRNAMACHAMLCHGDG